MYDLSMVKDIFIKKLLLRMKKARNSYISKQNVRYFLFQTSVFSPKMAAILLLIHWTFELYWSLYCANAYKYTIRLLITFFAECGKMYGL